MWLTVELFREMPGPIIPDLFAFGTTGFSALLPRMNQIWKASGLAQQYRARWRIEENFPKQTTNKSESIRTPFQTYRQEQSCPKLLTGDSLSAAAMAAMWAAAGQYPLAQNQTGEENGEREPRYFPKQADGPLRLNPSIIISASLELTDGARCNADTRLAAIADGSIQPKVDAAAVYCQSKKKEASLFDSVIVFGEDALSAREQLNTSDNEAPEYQGVRVIDDCQTIGDAMHWLLEQNLYFDAFSRSKETAWLDKWTFSKNGKGEFLDANHQPIDQSQPDWESQRVNTGSLEFMRNPYHGAKETELEPNPDDVAEPEEISPDPE